MVQPDAHRLPSSKTVGTATSDPLRCRVLKMCFVIWGATLGYLTVVMILVMEKGDGRGREQGG